SASTFSTRVEDALAAIAALRAHAGVVDVALVGLHLGALVALAAAVRAGAAHLVLCDPVTQPKPHVRNLVRSNVVLQNQYFGKAERGEEALRQELAAGRTISMYGYPLAQPLVAELEALDPAALLRDYRGRSLLLGFAPREAPPKKDLVAWQEQL